MSIQRFNVQQPAPNLHLIHPAFISLAASILIIQIENNRTSPITTICTPVVNGLNCDSVCNATVKLTDIVVCLAASLPTGTYMITNVSRKNHAAVLDANDKSPVVASLTAITKEAGEEVSMNFPPFG
jgi:hypothetical protein